MNRVAPAPAEPCAEPVRGPVWPFPAKLLDYPSRPPGVRPVRPLPAPKPPLPDDPALF